MQDYVTLKLLDRLEKVFASLGVDYKVMRKILQVKLTMDGRRVPTIFSQNAKKKDKEPTNQYIKSLWLYVLFGLIFIPMILMGDSYLFQMSFVYGIFTFFIMTSLISDFSSVLLDIRDRTILYPKPVDRRTISMAKLMHVIIYLSYLTIALVGIPLIVGLFTKGILFFIVTVINIILLALLIVVFTALIYFLILRFFDGEKLKDIINYVQIGLSLAIMIGYQLLGRSFELLNLTVTLKLEWWQVFVFPIWYGANTDLLLKQNFEPATIMFSVLGLLMPILAIWIYIKLTPAFEQNLQKLSYHGKAKQQRNGKLRQALVKVICRSKEEQAFFRFAALMMKNEREFKLRVYPSLGFSVVIPLIFIFGVFRSDFENLANSNSYLSIYFSLIIIPTIMIVLKFSGKYKGAWIYKAAPLEKLAPMFSGTVKSFIVNLYLPIYLLLSILFVFLFGTRILPDLIVVFLHACIYAVVCFMLLKKSIPFSQSFDEFNQNGTGIIIFGLMLIVGLLAGLHYLSTLYTYGIYLYLVVAIVGLVILWKQAFKITWEKIYE
ncbi:hypothetical protein [Lysinibacillus sp. SGAir0095]|uniref:hypothetical protein n=1 Tax=Lysinibacillus sp. SGAir0095 TaxID=2070463 RepID=UPI0010CD12F6|nr:hypothetical protein [Lysinibacillus sp. SGAir0095]QCR31111.1 hypothetical protein C1N55_02600 [Lysinibacillus sp. SGAir0095]